jgi:hypothetical protein
MTGFITSSWYRNAASPPIVKRVILRWRKLAGRAGLPLCLVRPQPSWRARHPAGSPTGRNQKRHPFGACGAASMDAFPLIVALIIAVALGVAAYVATLVLVT